MSYKTFRIPRRLRKKAQFEISQTGAPVPEAKRKYRRTKRRMQSILRDHGKRQIDKKWLETHVWHAKRFKMVNIWGFRIALHPFSRGDRAAYRFTRSNSVLYDSSYISPIQIHGRQSLIATMFTRLTLSQNPIILSRMFIDGSRYGKVFLYDPISKKPLAPVEFMWRPTVNKELDPIRDFWIWVHPSTYSLVLQTVRSEENKLQNITINTLQQELVRYELIGPSSSKILRRVLAQTTEELASNKAVNALSPNVDALPRNVILGLKVYDPRISKLVPKTSGSKIPHRSSSVNDEHFHTWHPEWAYSSLWDEKERKNHSLKLTELDITSKTTTIESMLKSQTEILLLQKPGKNGFGKGWTIIAQTSWGIPFWRSLVYAGGRAIGLKERYHLYLEEGSPIFPNDFPDTPAGTTYEKNREKDLEEFYKKRPPAKKTKLSKIRNL